jgi:hypothetical protein
MKKFLRQIHSISKLDFGHVSRTFTHEDVLHRGIHRSIAKYFSERKDGKKRIKLEKIEKERILIRIIMVAFVCLKFNYKYDQI